MESGFARNYFTAEFYSVRFTSHKVIGPIPYNNLVRIDIDNFCIIPLVCVPVDDVQ
jgi:hypothetical protein